MKEQLDPDACSEIVVENTPKPGRYRGPDQFLLDLGILGDNEAEVHRAGIIQDLTRLGAQIDGKKISSGPAVTVGDCTASVLDNAH